VWLIGIPTSFFLNLSRENHLAKGGFRFIGVIDNTSPETTSSKLYAQYATIQDF
jgi:hypothetical protein